MIVTIAKRFTFDAAHRLDRLPPTHKCHRLHGHTYQVEFVLRGKMDDRGFVADYDEIAQMWLPLHGQLDHRYLNEVPGLEIPSTENLALWIWRKIREDLREDSPTLSDCLVAVRVSESSSTWAEVTKS